MPKSPMQTKAKSNDTMMKGVILFLMLAAISVFVIGDANIAGTINATNITASGTVTANVLSASSATVSGNVSVGDSMCWPNATVCYLRMYWNATSNSGVIINTVSNNSFILQ